MTHICTLAELLARPASDLYLEYLWKTFPRTSLVHLELLFERRSTACTYVTIVAEIDNTTIPVPEGVQGSDELLRLNRFKEIPAYRSALRVI